MKKRIEPIKQYSLRIPDKVLREARKKGIDCNLSLREIVEKLLNLWIEGKVKI
jgi:hypothetical protein